MNAISKSLRTTIIFIIIVFLNELTPTKVYSQGPNAPEAASFEPVDATDMVSLLSGDLSYVLPLISVPSPEGGYPLALAYHAGIAMEQEASWVGLGWNVNPGAINRTISGYPDDWKSGKKAEIIFDIGGVYRSYNLGVSMSLDEGLNSYGVQASYATHKTFGGETSHNFDINFTHTNGIGITRSIGTSGIGLSLDLGGIKLGESRAAKDEDLGANAQLIGFSIGANYSFKGEGFSVNAKASLANNLESTGFNLSSKGGASLYAGNNSISLSGSSAPSTPISFNNTNIGITFPLFKVVRINLSFNKSRYWLFDKSELQCLGSLYASDLTSQLNNHPLPYKIVTDSYESVYKLNSKKQFSDNNFSFVSYDNYSVSGQGIGGSLTPNLYEHGSLRLKRQVVANGTSTFEYDDSFTKKVNNSQNDIYFNFDGTHSSYLKVQSGDWLAPSATLNNIIDLQLFGKSIISTTLIDGVYKSNYNIEKKRKTSGPFVEVFTNQEIVNNPSLIIEAKNFNRNATLNSESMLGYGESIGAYKITALDGKTYHYSLPVYQKEQFTRSAEKEDDPELRFYEEQNFSPYVTHWLLTAVTGPDYVDKNSNNLIDVEDYGYWVNFEYGKWSDGFAWRNPDLGNFESENSKSYSWGIKEIYYLDAIKTRTHTALFVKDERQDNMSSSIYIHDPGNINSPKVYNDNTINNYIKGQDGKWYFTGIYTERPIPSAVPYNWSGYSNYKFLVNINKHKSLRLKRILLLKNSDVPQALNTLNGQEVSSSFQGKIKFDENFRIFNSNGQLFEDYDETPIDKIWYGEFYQNVLDINDINLLTPNIEDRIVKAIDFDYDENYPLAANTPTSDASSKGRLTLKNLIFRGTGGIQQIPPYAFRYLKAGVSYSKTDADSWGYNKYDPSNWSLYEIENPLGGKTKIRYESDDYHSAAVGGIRSFSANLQLRFTGSDPGEKWVEIRWDPNYADINQPVNDFRKYFEVGAYSKGARIEFARHSSTSSGNRYTARILNQDLLITDVNQTEVKFKLPTNSTPNVTYEEASLCDDDNFVYYVRYSGSQSVVGKTSGWVDLNSKCDIDNRGEESIKAFVQGNINQFIDVAGGGIRVKSIETLDNIGNSYKKYYYYNNLNYSKDPNNTAYKSSGITSYTPTDYFQEIPYRTELPSPSVMYNSVTVESLDSNNEVELKTIYRFKTLEPMIITQGNGDISLGEALKISTTQQIQNDNIIVDNEISSIQQYKYSLENNLSSIGKLLGIEVLNNKDQIISKTINNYRPFQQIKQGISKESFSSFKRIKPSIISSVPFKYMVNVSSKTTYPSVLESTITTQGGFTSTTYYNKHDFNTGQVLETTTTDSKGNEFKTELIPAYTIQEYSGDLDLDGNGVADGYGMGSKVDNETNKNMLTQEAMTKTYLKVGAEWKETGVGITTWNSEWTYRDYMGNEPDASTEVPVWRKHKAFVWDGSLNADGTLQGFTNAIPEEDDESFIWTVGPNITQTNTEWKNVSTTTRYDHYSAPLEMRDINGNYAATKMGDGDSKVIAVSNAKYTEMYYSGAEYFADNGETYFDGGFGSTPMGRSSFTSHTGEYSFSSEYNTPGFTLELKQGEHRSGKYKISVWVYKVNHSEARISVNGDKKPFNGEEIFAGDWVLKTHYEDLDINQNEYINIVSQTLKIYFDDFRVHPVASSMTSYVYNEWDELWCIIGANGLATKFEYDEAGRLEKTYTEVEDFDNGTTDVGTGGFKPITENDYNYKNLNE